MIFAPSLLLPAWDMDVIARAAAACIHEELEMDAMQQINETLVPETLWSGQA